MDLHGIGPFFRGLDIRPDPTRGSAAAQAFCVARSTAAQSVRADERTLAWDVGVRVEYHEHPGVPYGFHMAAGMLRQADPGSAT